jgi:hypothetical protein
MGQVRFDLRVLVPLWALLAWAAPAGAVELAVDTTLDAVDAAPGDGVCASAGGSCALRAAVMEANALPGRDVIRVPAGTYLLEFEPPAPGTPSIETDAGVDDLDVTSPLVVIGAGDATSITGDAQDQPLFRVHATRAVFASLAIENVGAPLASGVGIVAEPGAELKLADVAFRSLRSECCGGGAILAVDATLHVLRSRFELNGSEAGGSLAIVGGRAHVADSSFEGNAGYMAPGIWSTGAELLIERSRFVGNHGAEGGTAIRGDGVTLLDSVVADNGWMFSDLSILQLGGGSLVENTTITGNTSFGPVLAGDGSVVVRNSAITGNATYEPAAVTGVIVEGSILAGNTVVSPPDSPDCRDVTSGGGNLFGVACLESTLDPSDLAGSAEAPLDPSLACGPEADCPGVAAPAPRCGLGGELLLLLGAWRAARRA